MWRQDDFDCPGLLHEIKHNMHRRAFWHDYYAEGSYLITFSLNRGAPVDEFSELEMDAGGNVRAKFSWTGWCVYCGIRDFCKGCDDIDIDRYVIMPDHVHMLVIVKNRLERHLGSYMNMVKSFSTAHFRKRSIEASRGEFSLFEENYNDRIFRRKGQLKVWREYIADNPRRLWVMRHNREYFEQAVLRFNAEKRFHLYGNIFLLDYPEQSVVRFSRSFSNEEWLEKREHWRRVAKNRGVLISPFVNPNEVDVMRECVRLGARIIKLGMETYGGRKKPAKEEWGYCSEGLMLIIDTSPDVEWPQGRAYTREVCMRLNRIAEWMEGRDYSRYLLERR